MKNTTGAGGVQNATAGFKLVESKEIEETKSMLNAGDAAGIFNQNKTTGSEVRVRVIILCHINPGIILFTVAERIMRRTAKNIISLITSVHTKE